MIDPSLMGPTVNEPAVPAPPGDHTSAAKAPGSEGGLPATALSVVKTPTVSGAKNPVRERPLPASTPVAGSDLPTGNLEKSQFRFRQPLGGGTSKGSLLLTDHQGRKFVFKPAEHESHTGYGGPGKTIEAGDRYRRVGAAKIVADALGVRTPEGTSVTLDGVVGSLQKWEPGSVLGDGSKRTEADVRKIQESLDHHDLDIYDFVIANMDRNAGNVLVADDGGLVAIDNDVSFPASNLRYGKVPLENMRPGGKLTDWQRKIPPTITAEMAAQMRAMAANEPEMRKKLAAYLDPVEIDGAFHRLDLLLRLMDTKGYPAIE